jgi:defect in organelle trafficking protein DotC
MKIIRFLVFLLLPCLIACQSANKMGTSNLAQLKSIRATGTLSDHSDVMRAQALQDTALSLGAQAGLYWRAQQINDILQDHSKELDRIFNFNRFMLSDHVLPPVLQSSNKNLKLDGIDTIRLSDELYIIKAQAKFVTTPPNWRDYLWLNFKPADMPADNMLPNTSAERKIWKQYVAIGWQKGVQQADLILHDNLSRLVRDVKGMILYRKLLAQRMVSKPFVQKNNLGVTGGGDSLRIHDQILQITALPALQVDARKWQPIDVPAESKTALAGELVDE